MATEMAFKTALLGCLIMCMASPIIGQVFDVTKYGAVGDGRTENSKAFLAAWKAACDYEGNPSFLIPTGTFLLGQVSFQGPCSNVETIRVDLLGTLKALPSIKDFRGNTWVEFHSVRGLEISGGGTIDGQGGAEAWQSTKCPQLRKCKNMPTSLQLSSVTDGAISDITLLDSKGFHMKILRSVFINIHHLNISAPGDSPNTDGMHISDTNHINVTDMVIATGDDCISIGPGSIFVNIAGVVCGPGHGISIGSLGKYQNEKDVSMVTVKNCTLKNTDNGVRIKTWPGSTPSVASHFTFQDIIMQNVSNPVIIDQLYCPSHHCTTAPSQVKIRDVTFRHITGTTDDAVPVSLVCSSAMPCEEVHIEDINLERVTANGNSTISSVCTNVDGTALGVAIPQFCM